MRALLILALCLAAVAGNAVQRIPQRIVGGSYADISEYPSIVALLYSRQQTTYSQYCAGTILNANTILTAAHCTIDHLPQNWRIRLGSSFANIGGTVYAVQIILNHPNYNRHNFDSDIALLRSATAMGQSNVARPAYIAGSNYHLADDQAVWAPGWGVTSSGSPSERLQHVQIWTINQGVCRDRYGSAGYSITDNMLCSGWLDIGGRDQCQGDSGGPLYFNDIVVGVCSWGFGCGDPYFPGVNTRVSRFAPWIQANA